MTFGDIDYEDHYKNHKHFLLPSGIADYDGFFLGALDICVTTRCSLRCRGCAHLMYLYDERADQPIDDVISSLDKVFSCIDFIARINIIGGEPLLYRHLPELLNYLAEKSNRFGIIKITTNGTIVPKNQNLYDALRREFIKICISNYDLPQTRAAELKRKLADEGVLFTDTIYDLNDGWYDFGDCHSRNRTKEELEEQYERCDVEWFSMFNGTIYACPRAAHMAYLGLFDASNDSVSLDDPNLKQSLWSFIYDKRWHECCDRCDLGTNDISFIPVAEQIKSPRGKSIH